MSTLTPWALFLGINAQDLNRNEKILLDIELFLIITEELENKFKSLYQDYFNLIKFANEKEENMQEANLTRLILTDILSSEAYTLEGIAQYADICEEVLQDILTGWNSNPSVGIFRKLVSLHREVKHETYQKLFNKMIEKNKMIA